MADLPASVIPLFNPDGDLIDVPAASVQAAIRQGWQQATPQQVAAYERSQKYGTTGQQVATFAEGIGQGVLGPVIPAVEQAFGVPAEDIRGRAEENPVSHGVGVATGIVGSIAAPVGATAKAFTLPGLAAKAGMAARGALPAAEGFGARALQAAVGMGTETAVFGAADVAERAVLKDPSLTAESALATVGVSGILGGLLGGGGSLAKDAFSAGLSRAYGATQRAYVKAFSSAEAPGAAAANDAVAGAVAAAEPGAGAEAAATAARASARKGSERELATFMMEHKQEIRGFEKMVGGITDEMWQASSPETAAWMLKNKDAIAEFEKSFPGIKKALARANPETAERILSQRGKIITDPLERIQFADQQGKVIEQAYESVDAALKGAYQSARPAEVAKLAAGIAPDAAHAEAARVTGMVGDAIKALEADPAAYPASYASKLKKIQARLGEVAPTVETSWDALGNKVEKIIPGAEPAEVYKALNEAKQLVGDLSRFDRMASPEHRDAQNFLKGLYRDLRTSLESEETWGSLGGRQKEFNKAVSEFLDAKEALERRLMEGKAGDKEMSVTKVNAWLNAMADPRGAKKTAVFNNYAEAGKRLADQMEKSGLEGAAKIRAELESLQKVTGNIEERAEVTQLVKMLQGHEILSSGPAIPMEGDVARAVLHHVPGGSVVSTITGTIKAAADVPNAIGIFGAIESMASKTGSAIEKGISAIFRPAAEGVAAAEAGRVIKPSEFAKVAEAVRTHAGDLEGTAGKLAQATAPIADHAPDTTAALHGTAARAVSHLADNLPTRQQHSPLDPPFQPSQAQLSAFGRRLEVAENPVSVLAHVRAGTLTPEHLEALAAIYPSLGTEMRSQLMEKVASEIAGGKAIPYRTRLGVSMFLGGNLDSSTTPQALTANQKTFASLNAQQAANEAAQQQAMAKITVASRTSTPAQVAANRRMS